MNDAIDLCATVFTLCMFFVNYVVLFSPLKILFMFHMFN